METSALQADNVEKLFYEIADVLVLKRNTSNGNSPVNHSPSNVNIDQNQKTQYTCFSCQ
jgi:hypothetical protein